MHEAWFADEDGVRQAVGLVDKAPVELQRAKEVRLNYLFFQFYLFIVFSLCLRSLLFCSRHAGSVLKHILVI